MNLDLIKNNIRIIAILGVVCCFSMISFSLYNLYQNNLITLFILILGYSVFGCCGIIYFLFAQNRDVKEAVQIHQLDNKNKILCRIMFFIFVIFCLISLNSELYTKSFLYYFIIAIISVLIIIQTIMIDNETKGIDGFFILIQILILSLLIRGSSVLINPYLMGPDVLYHFHNLQKAIEIGYLNEGFFHYFYFPSYYLSQTTFGILTNFSEGIFNLCNLLISVLTVLIAFIVGEKIFDDQKAGLISALLISVSPMSIFCMIFNTSKIGGLFLFLLCLFIQIKIIQTQSVRLIALFWICVLPLFLWHPEVSMALIPILLAYLLTEILFRAGDFKGISIFLSSSFLLYLVAYSYYLLFVHTGLGTSLVDTVFSDRKSVGLIQQIEKTVTTGFDFQFIFQCSLAYLGITIMVFFTIFLIFQWLKNPDKLKVFLILTVILLHLNPLLGIFTGKLGLGAERALLTTSVFMSILASGAIIEIFSAQKWKNILIFSFIILIISFFSVSSYLIGDGNDVFNDKIPRGTNYASASNLASHDFLNSTPSNSQIYSDYETLRYNMDPYRGYYNLPERSMSLESVISSDFVVINKPTMKRLKWEKTEQGELFEKTIDSYNVLYQNGDILIYKNIK